MVPQLYMERVKFQKTKQRNFLNKVMQETNSPSLKELSRRLNINYSTLKNYYTEKRLLPLDLFDDLCTVPKINKPKTQILDENWGKIKGGKKSKKH